MANAVAALGDIHEASLNLPTPVPSCGGAGAAPGGAGGGGARGRGASTPPPSARPASSLFIIDQSTLGKLLVALNECSEWGRIAILTTLSRYKAVDEKESEQICERVMPQFQHVNAAVVLGAVKVSLP